MIEPKIALLYVSAVAMVGVFGEIIVGNVYNHLFGHHLWDYRVFPIHNGFTSNFAPVIWGSYGLYLYMSHDNLMAKQKVSRESHLALLFCIETIILEVIVNALYRLLYGHYLFFYNPNDLWHLSSLRGIPFYFLTGLVIFYVVKLQRKRAVYFSLLNLSLISVPLIVS